MPTKASFFADCGEASRAWPAPCVEPGRSSCVRLVACPCFRGFSPFSLPAIPAMPDRRNLFNKVWDLHTVRELPSGQTQLFIGLHLVHEVTSPQAFAMLRERGLKVAYPERTYATVDHI